MCCRWAWWWNQTFAGRSICSCWSWHTFSFCRSLIVPFCHSSWHSLCLSISLSLSLCLSVSLSLFSLSVSFFHQLYFIEPGCLIYPKLLVLSVSWALFSILDYSFAAPHYDVFQAPTAHNTLDNLNRKPSLSPHALLSFASSFFQHESLFDVVPSVPSRPWWSVPLVPSVLGLLPGKHPSRYLCFEKTPYKLLKEEKSNTILSNLSHL